MKCPKCGSTIEQGSLYCKNCGEEIMIVPDFEPELENSMHEILTGVADDMTDRENNVSEENRKPEKKGFILSHLKLFLPIFGILVVLIAAVLTIYMRSSSFNIQMNKAEKYMEHSEYDRAIEHYQKAIEIDPGNCDSKYGLGNAYLQSGEKKNALLMFQETAICEGNLEVRIDACERVVKLYEEEKDYRKINNFLLSIDNFDVTIKFQKYMAKAPDFSYAEGTYDTVVPLKLTSNTAGTIYFTTDGSTPDRNSEVYSTPIFLETGDYVISAFFINEFNVESEIITKTYHIDVSMPVAPEVSTYSGDYDVPTLISVETPENGVIYYTADGTVPTMDSTEYSGPIHMPIGQSVFQFATCNEQGVFSETVSREYNLKLNTQITVEDAQKIITQGMYDAGKIYDLSGLSYEIWGRYLYRYLYVTSEDPVGDVFIVEEIYQDLDGVETRTGALYAVGLYDGKRYSIKLDENNQYVFNEF